MAFIVKPEASQVSIVLRGNFNPVIFTPAWFRKNDLLGEEAESADVKIIHPEVAHFETDWLTIKINKTAFSAEAKEEPWVRLHDLVIRTFAELLKHTPINMLGINYTIDFPADLATRDKIGNTLAPKAPWGEWGRLMESGEGEKHGGLRQLVMEMRNLDDRAHGHVQVSISPSLENDQCVNISVNDHFEFPGVSEEANGAIPAMTALDSSFNTSLGRAEELINHVMRIAVE